MRSCLLVTMMARVLQVLLNELLVGTITWTSIDRSTFVFDDAYRELSNRSVLSLFFRTMSGGLKQDADIRSSRMQVHPFFSNLLPEGHLREYLAEKLQIDRSREAHLIEALGGDLPGAVIVRSAEKSFESQWSNSKTISDKQQSGPDGALKFSFAGIQMKFSAIMESSGGLTIPAHGENGTYIVKLPSGKFDKVPESEYASLHLAKEMGIQVAESALIETESVKNLPKGMLTSGTQSLSVKRFDRDGLRRIHVEDFAQVYGKFPAEKYKGVAYHDLAKVLWIVSGEEDLAEFIRRLVFSLGIGNGDMHLKNWSLIYPDGINPRLSPAYDFVPTVAFSSDRALALSIGGEKIMSKITFEHFDKFAAKAELPSRLVQKLVRESVDAFSTVWVQKQDSYPLPPSVRADINEHLGGIELFRSARHIQGFSTQSLHFFYFAGLAGDAGVSLSNNPESTLYNNALALKQINEFGRAMTTLSMSLDAKESWQGYYNRGNLKYAFHDLFGAIEDFGSATSITDIPQASYNFALSYINLQERDDTAADKYFKPAEKAFNRATQLDPKMYQAWYNLGVMHLSLQHSEQAIRHFKKTLELNPLYAPAAFNLGAAHLLNGDMAEAKQLYERASELDSKVKNLAPLIESFSQIRVLIPMNGPPGPAGPQGPSAS